MDWLTILLSIIGGLGGVGGAISIYNAKANKNTIEINNFHQLIEEERTERQILRQEFNEYKDSVEKRVSEVKSEMADLKSQNQKMSAAIYSAYRCTYPQSIDECPVWQTYEKLECQGCRMKEVYDESNEMMDMDYEN